jgi:hypothetical protein
MARWRFKPYLIKLKFFYIKEEKEKLQMQLVGVCVAGGVASPCSSRSACT